MTASLPDSYTLPATVLVTELHHSMGHYSHHFPLAISRSASFSSSASASNRLSRLFCSRSSLSSFAASLSVPPDWRRQLY